MTFSETSPRPTTLAALIALGLSAVALGVLYFFNPYASGYGANPVTIAHFANTLWMAEEWNHCYLVPFAIGAMVYVRRKDLLLSEIRSSWLGLGVVTLGLFVYWLGFRADNIYLGYASLQILVGGLILWLAGWTWFCTLFFAWAFMVFLYPVPFLDNIVAFPLRMIMSEASVNALNIVGIGAVKNGTAILSAAEPLAGLKVGERFSVDVADPCSGIRSLFALMMVSALYGYFTQPGVWRKIVMFLCSFPLAVAGNLVRILMLTVGTIAMGSETAIGSHDDPSTFHMMAGFFVFGVAIAGLLGIGHLLNMDWSETIRRLKQSLHSPPRPKRQTTGPSTSHVHDEY